jgi:hypothetical protein
MPLIYYPDSSSRLYDSFVSCIMMCMSGVQRPHPNSPIHIASAPTSVASSTASPQPVRTSPMISLSPVPSSPAPAGRPLFHAATHAPSPLPPPSVPTSIPSTPPSSQSSLSSIAAGPTPVPVRASRSSKASSRAIDTAATPVSNREALAATSTSTTITSTTTTVTSRVGLDDRARRARDRNIAGWCYGIGTGLLAATAILVGSRVMTQKR